METINLVLPTIEHKEAAEEMKLEFLAGGETMNGCALLDQMEYMDWLENTRNNSCSETVRDDWVVASTFFAFLNYAKSIGLSKVMLGCYADNMASRKTIIKCGGILTEEKPCLDGTPMNVYWIVL